MKDKTRAGCFAIPVEMIDTHPELIMSMMGRCIPLQVIRNDESQTITYVAVSPDFEEVSYSEGIIPSYTPDIRDMKECLGFTLMKESNESN
jgi:hypothetical protein